MIHEHDSLMRALIEQISAQLLAPAASSDPVIRYAEPEGIAAAFAESVGLSFAAQEPAHGDADLLAATEQVLRWSAQTSHPRFVNQNFAGADPLGVVGDWIGAALNTTNATYEVAPVFTLMERAVIDKLASLAGFPRSSADKAVPPGMFCPGGSVGLLFALQLARHRQDPEFVRRGATGEPMAIFVSDSGHYSAGKAAALLGLGLDAVVSVDTGPDGAMLPAALEAAVARAGASGRRPLAVIATAGTTVTGAFDPLVPIADLCARRDIWMHVDGAYGGSALFSASHRHRLAGIERADSFVWDLHKMMGMTQQCSVLLVSDPDQLEPCFATHADYLFQPDKRNASLDAGDRTFQCGRRVDVMKLWLSWKAHGDSGFAARVDRAVSLADHVRTTVTTSDGRFAPLVAGDFTNVCVLWVPPELRPLDLATIDSGSRARLHALAPRVKARMQDAGTALIGVQPLHGLNCFRLLFMNPRVTTTDAQDLLDLIDLYATEEWTS
jgi:glutamate/tyrosine decarboxylase-like PLP-dependent enzyme